jgi:hypothetical protein
MINFAYIVSSLREYVCHQVLVLGTNISLVVSFRLVEKRREMVGARSHPDANRGPMTVITPGCEILLLTTLASSGEMMQTLEMMFSATFHLLSLLVRLIHVVLDNRRQVSVLLEPLTHEPSCLLAHTPQIGYSCCIESFALFQTEMNGDSAHSLSAPLNEKSP